MPFLFMLNHCNEAQFTNSHDPGKYKQIGSVCVCPHSHHDQAYFHNQLVHCLVVHEGEAAGLLSVKGRGVAESVLVLLDQFLHSLHLSHDVLLPCYAPAVGFLCLWTR